MDAYLLGNQSWMDGYQYFLKFPNEWISQMREELFTKAMNERYSR